MAAQAGQTELGLYLRRTESVGNFVAGGVGVLRKAGLEVDRLVHSVGVYFDR